MDKIGIVTITYNSAKVLESFFECIWNQNHVRFVLYIIDNNSTDTTVHIINKQKDDRLYLKINKDNLGVAKANNQGIQLALKDGCKNILIINNDIEFNSRLINDLIIAQEKKSASLVAPKIMYFDNPNHIWYAGGWFAKNNGFLPKHRGMRELDNGQYNSCEEVHYAPTCCLLIKAKVFRDIGLMDDKYFVYFDDTDFLYRVWKDKRHKVFYIPQIEILHKVGSLTKSFLKNNEKIYRSNFFIKQNIKNHIYFLRKIGSFISFIFIIWLFFRNNIKFLLNPYIKKDFNTFKLINKSYFDGIRM